MKLEMKGSDRQDWAPVTVSITLETRGEAKALKEAMMVAVENTRGGSLEERMAYDIQTYLDTEVPA